MRMTENGQQVNAQPTHRSEDIRFAVVLNGGVSLAIWMSGVTYEIDALTKARLGEGPYGALLKLLQATARVDVIAGTSAGGINGVFLALGQVFRDTDLSKMGKLWTDRGGLESLLRDPREKGAKPSLMRGDGYFLQELRKSLDTVLKNVDRDSPNAYSEEHPVDLFLTTTILTGQPWSFADDLGQRLCEIEHMGRFAFSYRPQPVGAHPAVNHFVGDEFVTRLALAARSTASFPGAFEPSFIPVNDRQVDGAHPDMSEVADFDVSRFGVDGGVLLNKPIKPVLEAIWRQSAMRQVRRALLYVNPDQSRDQQSVADRPQEPPSLLETLYASINIMTMQQSAGEQIREIQSANERAERIRSARIRVTDTLTDEQLDEIPDHIFDLYRRVRARQAAMEISNHVVDAACEDAPCKKRLRSWLIEQLAPADTGTYQPLPYMPAPDALKSTGSLDVNRWGIAPIERLAAFVVSLLRRAIWLLPPGDPLLPVVQEARRGALDERDQIAALRKAAETYWSEWASDASVQTLLRQVTPGSAEPVAAEALKDALDGDLNQWKQMSSGRRLADLQEGAR